MRKFINPTIIVALAIYLMMHLADRIWAQGAPPPDFNTTACIQKLGEEVQGELGLRVAILQLQKQVQDLQDELKAARTKK